MSVEQAIVEVVLALPEDQQQEVLEYANLLREKTPGPKKPFKSIRGL